ncbi:MAG: Pyrimidine ABC transporter, transmembrane component 2, partial [uncultured Rubellimicrobium sp.]
DLRASRRRRLVRGLDAQRLAHRRGAASAPRGADRCAADLWRDGSPCLGAARPWPERAARDPARAVAHRADLCGQHGPPLGRLRADDPQGRALGPLHRGDRRGRHRDPGGPLRLAAERAAAGGELHGRAAHRRDGADPRHVVRLRLAVQGGGRGADGVFPHAGEHRGGAPGHDRDAARPHADLRGGLLAHAPQAAAAGGDALHVQRAQGGVLPRDDRRHRRRILRLAHPGNRLSHLGLQRAARSRHGVGRDPRGGPCGQRGLRDHHGYRTGGDLLAPVATTL